MPSGCSPCSHYEHWHCWGDIRILYACLATVACASRNKVIFLFIAELPDDLNKYGVSFFKTKYHLKKCIYVCKYLYTCMHAYMHTHIHSGSTLNQLNQLAFHEVGVFTYTCHPPVKHTGCSTSPYICMAGHVYSHQVNCVFTKSVEPVPKPAYVSLFIL